MLKKAVIDIDNTLWPFWEIFYERLKGLNESFPSPDRWSNFDIWEGYFSEQDFYKLIDDIHMNQDNDRYKPYPDAKGFLSTLKDIGYTIVIASHRLPQSRKPTEKWLVRHGLTYDTLHLSFNKATLFDKYTHVVVDDSPSVLEQAYQSQAISTGLLFPWNKAYLNNGYKLFNNLNEVLTYIVSR